MEVLNWIGANWFDLLQSAGIISAFFFTAHTINREAETARISNLIGLAKHHSDLWRQLSEHPELVRVLAKQAPLNKKPVTDDERRFVTALILHLDVAHRAMRSRAYVKVEGLRADIRGFFSLPIPQEVWRSVKEFQNREFVEFVEDCLTTQASEPSC